MRDREWEKERDKKKDSEWERQTEKERESERDRQRAKEREKVSDTETEWEWERPTEIVIVRERETDRRREKIFNIPIYQFLFYIYAYLKQVLLSWARENCFFFLKSAICKEHFSKIIIVFVEEYKLKSWKKKNVIYRYVNLDILFKNLIWMLFFLIWIYTHTSPKKPKKTNGRCKFKKNK